MACPRCTSNKGAAANHDSFDNSSRFDPNFTQSVIDAIGPKATPRVRQVFASLIRHLHDFTRENEITSEEWIAAVGLLNEVGRMSKGGRDEGVLVSDIFGLESLIDEIAFKTASAPGELPTETAIRGPFWRLGAPLLHMGDSIVHGIESDEHTFVYGVVRDHRSGEPIENAEIDVWHTAPNGLYEQQDENQVDFNLHGRFRTGKDGRYSLYCLRPTSYPIPYDGPSGKILEMLDRHPMRPAHIHFYIAAPGYRSLITQIFDRRDENLKTDAVFAVKESLIVDFIPRDGDPRAQFELPYDFKLVHTEDTELAVHDATPQSIAI